MTINDFRLWLSLALVGMAVWETRVAIRAAFAGKEEVTVAAACLAMMAALLVDFRP